MNYVIMTIGREVIYSSHGETSECNKVDSNNNEIHGGGRNLWVKARVTRSLCEL